MRTLRELGLQQGEERAGGRNVETSRGSDQHPMLLVRLKRKYSAEKRYFLYLAGSELLVCVAPGGSEPADISRFKRELY